MMQRELKEVSQRLSAVYESDIDVVLSDVAVSEIRSGKNADEINDAYESVRDGFSLLAKAKSLIDKYLEGSEE